MGRAVGEGGELEVGVRLKEGRHCNRRSKSEALMWRDGLLPALLSVLRN